MIWPILITLAGILVTALVIWWVSRSIPPKQVSPQEMLSTKEGRERLAELIAKRYPTGPIKRDFEACPTCEGFGKLGHHTIRWDGGPAETTSNEICKDCGGTGIKGGLDYVNVQCNNCNGVGSTGESVVGPKCVVCNGTGVVKVRREDGSATRKPETSV